MVVDFTTGEPQRLGEAGEIVVRGPSVLTRYRKAPAANAAVLRDGRLHTCEPRREGPRDRTPRQLPDDRHRKDQGGRAPTGRWHARRSELGLPTPENSLCPGGEAAAEPVISRSGRPRPGPPIRPVAAAGAAPARAAPPRYGS
ncbi:hypothetical protein [Streptomyces sp900116325]|uniref:AMP-dependent synthetase/ligase domain-containing protein n=1 Tax=Streptomyces sp. 900116325 TaxID=3154295 RepID=A0ABV2UC19_9ACTN